MDALYLQALGVMEGALVRLQKQVPQPQRVPMKDSFVYRYKEKTFEQAILQKLARSVSGLHAARVLLEAGFVQEQAALQRMLDETQEDISFLAYALIYEDKTELHQRFVEAFYEEEFDDPKNPLESDQKRPMIPRDKIRAYIARRDENPDRMLKLGRVISKGYSGYVHGASPHIMEMYGGEPPRFHVSGMRKTTLHADHEHDLWNYFYRGICAAGVAAAAIGDKPLFDAIRSYSDDFGTHSGRMPSRKT